MIGALVSIIVPAYNVELYVEACIESIMRQTYPFIEVICINDGSLDATRAVLAHWERDARIRIIDQENKGLSESRNVGLEYARGKYVLFVDADDVICPNMVELLVAEAEKTGADLICCGTELIYHDCQQQKKSDERYYALAQEGCFIFSYELVSSLNVHVWNKLFILRVIRDNEIRFPVGLFYEDVAFMWLYYAYCQRVCFIPDKLYCYQRRASSIMGMTFDGNSVRALDHLRIARFIYNELTARNIDRDSYLPYFSSLLLGLYTSTMSYIPIDLQNSANQCAISLLKDMKFSDFAGNLPLKLRERLYDISQGRVYPQSLKFRHLLWEAKLWVRRRFFKNKV